MKGNKHIYQVPEGYFDGLKARLEDIPAEAADAAYGASLWQRLHPYVALAACFAVALVAGALFLGGSDPGAPEAELQHYYYTHLRSVEDPMALFYEEDYPAYEVSEDDILEYLISTGATADYVSYMINR